MRKFFLAVCFFLAACTSGSRAATPTVLPSPTAVPMPESLSTLPAGITAVYNEDGTWGIGTGTGDEITPISGVSVDAGGYHLTVDGEVVDIPADQAADGFKIGQDNVLQFYNETGDEVLYTYDTENKVWEKVQRTITFDLEGGGTMEMFQFDTLEEAFNYIVIEDGTMWGQADLPENTPSFLAFWRGLFKIPGLGDEFMSGIAPFDRNSQKNTIPLMVYSAGDGTIIAYRTDEGDLKAIFVNERASIVFARIVQESASLIPPRP